MPTSQYIKYVCIKLNLKAESPPANTNPNSQISSAMDPDSLIGRDVDTIMNPMTRLSLHPKQPAYPGKDDDAAMQSLIHALETAQADRIRLVAAAVNTQQRLDARNEEWRIIYRLGDSLAIRGEVRSVWQGWVDLLRWEMVVSAVEERLGLVAI